MLNLEIFDHKGNPINACYEDDAVEHGRFLFADMNKGHLEELMAALQDSHGVQKTAQGIRDARAFFYAEVATKSIAQHLAGCLHVLVNLYNDVAEMSARSAHLARFAGQAELEMPTKLIQAGAFPDFLQLFSVHHEANTDAIAAVILPLFYFVNSDVFEEQRSSAIHFVLKSINLLNGCEIPGIGKLSLALDDTVVQQRIDAVDFPADLIPNDYCCNLTGQLMQRPYSTNGIWVDFDKFIKACKKQGKEGGVNPFDQAKFVSADIAQMEAKIDENLQRKIKRFVEKVEWLAKQFLEASEFSQDFQFSSANKLGKYKKFKKELCNDSCDLGSFKAVVGKTERLNSSGLGRVCSMYQSADITGAQQGEYAVLYKKLCSQGKAEYEHCIRITAASGDDKKLQWLLTNALFSLKEVDVNAVGENGVNGNPPSRKTALHQVVIYANKAGVAPDKAKQYRNCYEALISAGALLDRKDRDGKTPLDYDQAGLLCRSASYAP